MFAFVSFMIVCMIIAICMFTAKGQQECDYNKTVVAKIGGNATFIYNTTPNITYWYSSNLYHGSTLIMSFYRSFGNDIDISYYYNLYENRTNVTGFIKSFDPYPGNITITLHNIVTDDNGMYSLTNDFSSRPTVCWILYIARIKLTPFTGQQDLSSEEGHPMSLTSSGSIPEGLNFNKTWLLDGSVIASGALYQITQNDLWILRTDRIINGHNITYRATYQDGLMLEENYTLTVTYGPDPNLIFIPDRSTFMVDEGGAIPDITCTAVCSPSCDITWTSDLPLHDTDGALLRLGTGTTEMEGEYHCTATRKGTYKSAIKTLVVIIKENENNTTAIVLGSLVGILTVGLIVAFVFIVSLYRLVRTPTQDTAVRENTTVPVNVSNTIAMETYSNLQPVSDSTESPYEPIRPQGEEEQTAHQSYYENTKVA